VVVLLGRQVDLLTVTALLTIAGYSINDTIVIYDRVRENMVMKFTMPISLLHGSPWASRYLILRA
jgi:preprotein translocase subunit SecF